MTSAARHGDFLSISEGHIFFASWHLGVGSNPDSLSLVRGTNVLCRYASPSHIKPHFGQVSEYDAKSSRSESWGVLHEDESRSYLANNPGHFFPEA
jgi:hypothetical protein